MTEKSGKRKLKEGRKKEEEKEGGEKKNMGRKRGDE